MKTQGVIVCLALAVLQVLAEEPLAFLEDAPRPVGSRIVSGWEAEEGQIPWQLSLRMVAATGSVSSCGGSIIHPLWGMTAAHCTATFVTLVLRAGAVSLTRPELLFEVTEYHNHPLYNDALPGLVQPNDISLLKFPREISFSDRVQPIRLQRHADRNRDYEGDRLEASGWGRTWTNGESPENLQWVYLVGESNFFCRIIYGGSTVIQDSTICAAAYNVTSQSTCQGDSGGPLVELEEDGKYTLVGVASFVSGAGCHTYHPAGFIRPGHYHHWYRIVAGIDFDWEHEKPTTVAPTTPPTTEASTTEASTTEAVTTEATTTEAATTEATTTEATTTEAATTEATTTEATTTEAETDATTEAATTEATTTEATTTEAPSSEEDSSSSSDSSSSDSSSDSSSSDSSSSDSSSSDSSSDSSSSDSSSSDSSSSDSSSSDSSSEE